MLNGCHVIAWLGVTLFLLYKRHLCYIAVTLINVRQPNTVSSLNKLTSCHKAEPSSSLVDIILIEITRQSSVGETNINLCCFSFTLHLLCWVVSNVIISVNKIMSGKIILIVTIDQKTFNQHFKERRYEELWGYTAAGSVAIKTP